MLVAGIIGRDGRIETANLINSILTPRGIKVSIIDSSNLAELDLPRFKGYLQEIDRNNTHILVVKICSSDIEKELFDRLHFDIIIYTDKYDGFDDQGMTSHERVMRKLFSQLDEKSMVIFNMDDSEIIKVLEGINHKTITYGFNSKASITASSIGDTVYKEGFICCQQKSICTRDGSVIEPQEYRIDVQSKDFDTNSVLAAVTFAIVNGVDLSTKM
jgi:UDP-N-acetylmuramate-alanine ligase